MVKQIYGFRFFFIFWLLKRITEQIAQHNSILVPRLSPPERRIKEVFPGVLHGRPLRPHCTGAGTEIATFAPCWGQNGIAALPGQPTSTATGITFRTGSNGGPNNGNVHYGHVWLSGIYSTMLKLNIYYIRKKKQWDYTTVSCMKCITFYTH